MLPRHLSPGLRLAMLLCPICAPSGLLLTHSNYLLSNVVSNIGMLCAITGVPCSQWKAFMQHALLSLNAVGKANHSFDFDTQQWLRCMAAVH